MSGAIHNRHKMQKCLDCPETVATLGGRKRCPECQFAVEKARKRIKEIKRAERKRAEKAIESGTYFSGPV